MVLPLELFTREGRIQPKYQEILAREFGFGEKGLKQTKYRVGRFRFGAITLYRVILIDRSFLENYSLKDWFGLIAHEQVHREDILCHPLGALGFYFSYLIGWAMAGFSYRKNEYEVKAYDMEAKARTFFQNYG